MFSPLSSLWNFDPAPADVTVPVLDDGGRLLAHVRYKGLAPAPKSGFDSLLAAFLAMPDRGRLIARYMVAEPEEADDLLAQTFAQQTREKGLAVYDESKHPRDNAGRFVPKAALARAARDPQELKRLQAQVTHPEEKQKLHAAVQAIQGRVGKRGGGFMPEQVGRAVAGRQSVAETADHIHRLRMEVGDGPPTADHLRRLAALLAWHSVAELRELKGHLGVQVSGDPSKESAVGQLANRALTWRKERMEQVKAQREKARLTARLKAEGHTGTDEHGREWENGELVSGKRAEPHQPMNPAEFERRMAAVDPRDSGAVDVKAKDRPLQPDDHDLERRRAAGDKLRQAEGWQADRPESVAAEQAAGRAADRVRKAGGGEALGEDDLPPAKVSGKLGDSEKVMRKDEAGGDIKPESDAVRKTVEGTGKVLAWLSPTAAVVMTGLPGARIVDTKRRSHIPGEPGPYVSPGGIYGKTNEEVVAAAKRAYDKHHAKPEETAPARSNDKPTDATGYKARISALKPGKSADIDGHTVTRGEYDPDVVTIETLGQGRRVDTLAGAVKHLEKLAGGKRAEPAKVDAKPKHHLSSDATESDTERGRRMDAGEDPFTIFGEQESQHLPSKPPAEMSDRDLHDLTAHLHDAVHTDQPDLRRRNEAVVNGLRVTRSKANDLYKQHREEMERRGLPLPEGVVAGDRERFQSAARGILGQNPTMNDGKELVRMMERKVGKAESQAEAPKANSSETPNSSPAAAEKPAKKVDWEPGSTVEMAGAKFTFVGHDENGDVVVRNAAGNEFPIGDKEVAGSKVVAGPPKPKAEDTSHTVPKDQWVKNRLYEEHADAVGKLNAVKAGLQKRLADLGHRLPVGISPEQYIRVHNRENKRPKKEIQAMERELDRAEFNANSAAKERANTRSELGTRLYLHERVHRGMVEAAKAAGKEVPPEVQAEYPDLFPHKATPPADRAGAVPAEPPAAERPATSLPTTGNPKIDAAANAARAALDRDDVDAAVAALSGLSHKDMEKAADHAGISSVFNSKTKAELVDRIRKGAVNATKSAADRHEREMAEGGLQSSFKHYLEYKKAHAAGHAGSTVELASANPAVASDPHHPDNHPVVQEDYRQRLLSLKDRMDPSHPRSAALIKQAQDEGHFDPPAKPTAAKPAGRMSFEQDDRDEPAYPSAKAGSLFDVEGDEGVHEGPHHKAVNDLLTAAGRRFPETQIGPRARHDDAHGETSDLDTHLNRLAGLDGSGYEEIPFNAAVSAHKGTVEELENGRFDDEHADDAVQHYREGEGNDGIGPGDGLSDLHQALSMNGHGDHAAWAQKHFDRLNQAFEDDIRRRHDERQAPKKAALAEKLKNPGALSEEEYDEHFPHQVWTHPSGAREWMKPESARKAMDDLPADMEGRVSGAGRSWNVLARKRQDSHEGYDLSGIKEEVLNSLHGEDGGRGLSELRSEISDAKHDPANPDAHPVHRAVKELADDGKVEMGEGDDPVVRMKRDPAEVEVQTAADNQAAADAGLTPVRGRVAWDGTATPDGSGNRTIYRDADGNHHAEVYAYRQQQEQKAKKEAEEKQAERLQEGEKNPHLLTKDEYRKLPSVYGRLHGQYFGNTRVAGDHQNTRMQFDEYVDHHAGEEHKNAVQRALTAGKQVPPEVMADYPGMTARRSYPDHLYDTNPGHLLALRKIQAAQDKHKFAMPPIADTGVDLKTIRELEKAGLVERTGSGSKGTVRVGIGGKMRMSAADELEANPALGDDLTPPAATKPTKKPDGNLYAAGKAILESGMTGIGDKPAGETAPARSGDDAAGKVADMAVSDLGVNRDKLMAAATALAKHEGASEPDVSHVAEAAAHYQKHHLQGKRPEDEYSPGSPAIDRAKITEPHLSSTNASVTASGGPVNRTDPAAGLGDYHREMYEDSAPILKRDVEAAVNPRKQLAAAVAVMYDQPPTVQQALAQHLAQIAPDAIKYAAENPDNVPLKLRSVIQNTQPQYPASGSETVGEFPHAPAGFQRQTPRQKTAEREKLENAAKAADEKEKALDAAHDKAREELEKVRPGTKKAEQLAEKKKKAWNALMDHRQESQELHKNHRTARLEDLVEGDKEEHALGALSELKHPAAGQGGNLAYNRLVELAKAQAKQQGYTEDEAQELAPHVALYHRSYPGSMSLSEQVTAQGMNFRRKKVERESRDQIDKMNLSEADKRHFGRQLDSAYSDDAAKRVVEAARDQHQKNEQIAADRDDFVLSGITPEGVSAEELQKHLDGGWHPVKKRNVAPPDAEEGKNSLKRLHDAGKIRFVGRGESRRVHRVEEATTQPTKTPAAGAVGGGESHYLFANRDGKRVPVAGPFADADEAALHHRNVLSHLNEKYPSTFLSHDDLVYGKTTDEETKKKHEAMIEKVAPDMLMTKNGGRTDRPGMSPDTTPPADTPVPPAGRADDRAGAVGGIEKPEFRDWRYRATSNNSGTIYPNKPGQPFTPEQVSQLRDWAKRNGMDVSADSTPNKIEVVGRDPSGKLDLSLHGAEGVKREAEAAASAGRKSADGDRKAQAEAEFAARPSAGFINDAFGDTMNAYNKAKLADLAEGKSDKFTGVLSPQHAEGFRKLGALTADGKSVDWEAFRRAATDRAGAVAGGDWRAELKGKPRWQAVEDLRKREPHELTFNEYHNLKTWDHGDTGVVDGEKGPDSTYTPPFGMSKTGENTKKKHSDHYESHLRQQWENARDDAFSAGKEVAEKPHWAMTWPEYSKQVGNERESHEQSVQKAIDAGRPVPAEVLSERLPAHVRQGLSDHPGHHVIDSDGKTHTVYSPAGEKVSEGPHADLGHTLADLAKGGKKAAVLDRVGRETGETADNIPVDPDVSTLSAGDIYQTTLGSGAKRYAVRGTNERSATGDQLFNTVEEAKAEREFQSRQAKSSAEFTARANKSAPTADTERAEKEDIDGFADDKSPMARQKAKAALMTTVRSNGRYMTRRDLIREMVNEGAELADHKQFGRILRRPNGAFIEQAKLTKTGMDYAEHLIRKRGGKPTDGDSDDDATGTPVPAGGPKGGSGGGGAAPAVGGYLDDDGNWQHGKIPDGAMTDGRQWLARKAAQDHAEAIAAHEKVSRRLPGSPPADRVKKMGNGWWAETIDGTTVPTPFKTKAAALEYLGRSDEMIVTNRRESVATAEQQARQSVASARKAGLSLPDELVQKYGDDDATGSGVPAGGPKSGDGGGVVVAEGGKKGEPKVRIDHTGYSHGQHDYHTTVEVGGKTAGYLDYTLYDNEITVKHVHVDPEYRRQGLATKMYDAVLDHHPDATLGGSMRTPEGSAFRDFYNARKPDRLSKPQEPESHGEPHTPDEWDSINAAHKKEVDQDTRLKLNDLSDRMNDWDRYSSFGPGLDGATPTKPDVKAELASLFPAEDRAGAVSPPEPDAATAEHPDVSHSEQTEGGSTVHHLKVGNGLHVVSSEGGHELRRQVMGSAPGGVFENHGRFDTLDDAVNAAGRTPDALPASDTDESPQPAAPPADPNTTYSLAEHDATVERLHTGQITPDELRSAHARLQQHKDAVAGELKKRTVPELRKLAGHWRASDMNKSELLKFLHEQMGEELVPSTGDARMITIGRDYDPIKEQAKRLEQTTGEHIQKHSDRMAKARDERKAKIEAAVAGMENPQTLEDFRRLERTGGGYDKMKPEHQIRYDELQAEARRGRSMAERQEKAKIDGFSGGEEAAGGINIVEGHHQKRNEKTHTVTVENRLGDEKFQEALSAAKRLGGSYVNAFTAKRYGATPGFQFFDRDKAEQFAKVLRGESVDRSADVAGEMAARQQNRAEGLSERAESLIGQGEESLGRERRTNTRRQSAMAASAEAQAREKIATGRTLQRIGDGQADGTLKHLNGVRSAEDLHTLDRALMFARHERMRQARGPDGRGLTHQQEDELKHAPHGPDDFPHLEYPHPSAHQSELQDIGRMLADEPGLKRFAERMKKEGDPTADVKFQGSVGGMKANGGVLAYDHHFRDHPEYTYIAHHMRGDGEGDKAVRVHASNDWRLAQAAEKAGESRFGAFYTADKGKSWAKDPKEAVLGAIRRGNALDHVDAPQEKRVKFTDPDDIEALRKAARKLRNHPNDRLRRIGQSLREKLEHHDRLKRADIHSLPELRAALREYLPLKQQADKEDPVKKAERELKGKDIPGFFPTPRPAIEDMLDRADIQPGHTVLEPSAGKGDILDAIRERHPDAQAHALEYNATLRDILQKKGHNVVGNDALDHVGQYDRIVMNPPFENGQDAKHVRHLYENHLAPGGRLVAITSEGPFSRSQKADQEFREWLESVGGVHEPMPEGSFAGNDAFRKTGVRTRMVTIDKPA